MVDKGYKQYIESINSKEEHMAKLIGKAIKDIEDEIKHHKRGVGNNANESQLQRISEELKKMKDTLNPQKYMPGYPRAIVDSWDLDSELGLMLLELVNKYKKL